MEVLMGELLRFPDRGMGGDAVCDVPSSLTFEQIADQWNLIPGVLPVRFSEVEPGRGIHKAVIAAIRKHPDLEWWMDLFEAVHKSDEKDDTSLSSVLKKALPRSYKE
jgi:hypothetical protein